MGIFSRRAAPEPMDDRAWLASGYARFDVGKSRFFGSPETMLQGGLQALRKQDTAAAVYYFAKAIDIAQTWTFTKPGERDTAADIRVFEEYVSAVRFIKTMRPDADLLNDSNNENGARTLRMMIAVAQDAFGRGRSTEPLDRLINEFCEITGASWLN
jgi:hypothetical protein